MCIHRWMLDQDSYGVCQKCGAEKQDVRPSDLPKLRPDQWKLLSGPSSFVASNDLYRGGDLYWAMEVAGLIHGDY